MSEINDIENWGFGGKEYEGVLLEDIPIFSERARVVLWRHKNLKTETVCSKDYIDLRFVPFDILPELEYHFDLYSQLLENLRAISPSRGYDSYCAKGELHRKMTYELNAYVCVLGRLQEHQEYLGIDLMKDTLFRGYLTLRHGYSAHRLKDKRGSSKFNDDQALVFNGQVSNADGTPVYNIQVEKTRERYCLNLIVDHPVVMERIYNLYVNFLGLSG